MALMAGSISRIRATEEQIHHNNFTTQPPQECSYLLLAPFSSEEDNEVDANYTELGAHFAAAGQLAIDSLNEREYAAATLLCAEVGITFRPSLITRDTQNEDTIAFTELVHTVEGAKNDTLCGIVGPFDFKGQEKTTVYTDIQKLPQFMLTGGDIDDLAGKDGKTSIGNMMDLSHYCEELAYFLKTQLSITHLTVIAASSKKARLLQQDMLVGMTKQGIDVRVLEYKEDKHNDWDSTRQDLIRVRDTGIRNIFLSPDQRKPEALYWMAQHLDALGMLNGEYQYFLFEDGIRPREIQFLFGQFLTSPDSVMARLLHGAGWFNVMEPFELDIHTNLQNPNNNSMDPFLRKFQSFDARRITYPPDNQGIAVHDDHFETAIPTRLSSFVYDSILAMGMGKCAAVKENQQKEDQDNSDANKDDRMLQKNKETKPPKNDLIRNIVQLAPFQGASGTVSFDYNKDERFRTVDTLQLAMFNFRVKSHPTNASRVTVETPIVAHYNKLVHDEWQILDDFIFATSTTAPPNPQFFIANKNYLSNWVFALGMTLFGIGTLFALASFVTISYYQTNQAVRLAQPFFLKLICLGSLIEVCALVPLSLDESRGLDDTQLDAACMSVPWLFFIGHATIYSAIFCKLWRVDQLMTARRRTRTEMQVLWPLGLVLFAVMTILTIWTVISPWQWERDLVNLDPPETYGKCHSEDFSAFFIPLAVILMVCTCFTGIIVWRTKNISQDLSDTSTVFYLILTQLQAWFVGLPILAVIGDGTVNSVYFGRILLIWVFAMAPLLIVLLPRITTAIHLRRHPEKAKKSRVRVTGLTPPAAPHTTESFPTSPNPQTSDTTAYSSMSIGELELDQDLNNNNNNNNTGAPTLDHISEHPRQEEAALEESAHRKKLEEQLASQASERTKQSARTLQSIGESLDDDMASFHSDVL